MVLIYVRDACSLTMSCSHKLDCVHASSCGHKHDVLESHTESCHKKEVCQLTASSQHYLLLHSIITNYLYF